jgi:hypothetical protein
LIGPARAVMELEGRARLGQGLLRNHAKIIVIFSNRDHGTISPTMFGHGQGR